MSRVFWDTNLFIYLFEGTDARAERVAALRQRMRQRHDQLYTSTLTLGEVLVKPLEHGDEELRQKYERALAGAVQLARSTGTRRDATRISARTAPSGRQTRSSSPAPPPRESTSSSPTTID